MTSKEDHKAGHRQRLRTRFMKSGPEALADYELLELILLHRLCV
jgi:DNA repair protein RadC